MRNTYYCPCLLGVEGLVAQELRDMGCEEVRAENGHVLFDGGWDAMARVNIRSRFAERVQILLGKFQAKSFEELFQHVKAIPWEDYLRKEESFPVSGSSLSSALHSIPDCQAIIKKAIVERLKQKYHIEWFPESGPVHKVRFLIMKDTVTIMIDTSGEGLHKRGYRKDSGDAPIKETLAACMAKLSRVRRDANLIDPFCGSGTILIESAMMAMDMAPGLKRKFAAENWRAIPGSVWQEEREAAKALLRRDVSFHGHGYDIDPAAVALARQNAKKAGVSDHITTLQQDIGGFDNSEQYGCVICNPPYGERLLDIKQAKALYKTMGRVFTSKRGWNYSIITADEDFEKLFGKKADKRRKLYNGMIRCQLYMYYK